MYTYEQYKEAINEVDEEILSNENLDHLNEDELEWLIGRANWKEDELRYRRIYEASTKVEKDRLYREEAIIYNFITVLEDYV